MPSDLSTYLALLKLVDDTSKDLRLSHLTASDKNVLLALTSFAGKNNEAEGFTYIRSVSYTHLTLPTILLV